MRFVERIMVVFLVIGSLAAHADTAGESRAAHTQAAYTAPPNTVLGAPTGAPGEATRPEPASREVVAVNLDNTGVSDWTFINPRRPAKVKPGVGVEFRNVTSDRTFIVSIPVTFKTTETSVRFPVLTRELGEAERRIALIGTSLLPAKSTEFVAEEHVDANWLLQHPEYGLLDKVDSHLRVRELIRDLDPTSPQAISTIDLAAYGKLVESQQFLYDPDTIEKAADALPKPLATLAARLRTLAGRLRGLQALRTPKDAAAILAKRQTALDRLRVLYVQLAANPQNKALIEERIRLEEIVAGKDVPLELPSAAPEAALLAKRQEALDRLRVLYTQLAADPENTALLEERRKLEEIMAGMDAKGGQLLPDAEAAVLAKRQKALERLKVLYTQLATDPRNKALLDEREKLEEIVAGNDAGQPLPRVETELKYVTNELLRLRGDYAELSFYVNRLRMRLAQSNGLDQPAYTAERTAAAKDEVLAELTDFITTALTARAAQFDEPLETLQATETSTRRFLRTWFSDANRRYAKDLDTRIALRKQTLEELSRQGATDVDQAIEGRLGVTVTNCTTTDGTVTCTASHHIGPQQTAVFSERFLRLGTPADAVFTFSIRFFDEADVPANPSVYMTRADKPKTPANSFVWNLVGTLGQKRDPELVTLKAPGSTTDVPAPASCVLLLCTEGHKNHFNGSGQLQLKQRIADYFEGSATIAFKSGDLGTTVPNPKVAPVKDDVTFSRYKFSIFAENGLALEFGKQNFANPSNGISISEEGEGFRIIFSPAFASGAYIIKRESQDFTANRQNRDSWVALVQGNNIPLSTAGPFRTITVTAVRGSERRFPTETPAKVPYDYQSVGVDAAYALPFVNVHGNVGFYENERDAHDDTRLCGTDATLCNGRGRAGIMTMTRSFGLDPTNKPRRSVSLTFARGTADDADTPTVNEGYTGENGSFAPDVIFLKTLTGSANTTFIADQTGVPALRFGAGIANKSYFGVTYVENAFSPLRTLVSDLLRVKDVASYSTTLRYHNYRMRRGIDGERGAGHEFDVEFMIEGPKGIKTTVGGGYYFPGSALNRFVHDNLWSLFSNVSVSFGP